jgi:hypothetical protein
MFDAWTLMIKKLKGHDLMTGFAAPPASILPRTKKKR